MNSVQSLVKKINKVFVNDTRHYLGRWRIDYCEKRLENKVGWTNEDHCGTCSRFKYPAASASTALTIPTVPKNYITQNNKPILDSCGL
jgi:hypothetical protein